MRKSAKRRERNYFIRENERGRKGGVRRRRGVGTLIFYGDISPKPNNEEYRLLRKAHVTTFVEVEQGVVYFPIGMGYMSSGHSSDVIRTCDFYNNRLRVYEEHVKKNIAHLVKEIRAKGIDLGDSLVFLLGIEDNDVYAFETKYRIFIKLGPIF